MHPSSCNLRLSDEHMAIGLRGLAFLPPVNDDFKSTLPIGLTATQQADLHDSYDRYRLYQRTETHAWPRHDGAVSTLGDMMRAVGMFTRLEVEAPGVGSRGRVDILRHDEVGNGIAYDVTVSGSDSGVGAPQGSKAGLVAERRAAQKTGKYSEPSRRLGWVFVPLVMEDSGFLHSLVHDLIRYCASRADNYEESVPEFTTWATKTFSGYWYQRMSRSIVAGSARIFLKRWTKGRGSRGPGATNRSLADGM